MKKLTYLILHCTATQEGQIILPSHIRKWHYGPKDLPNGTVVYKGKIYKNRLHLPDERIEGVLIERMKGRGWDRLGYALMFLLNGEKIVLTPHDENEYVESDEVTWGVAGINSMSRHIVYVGGLEKVSMRPKDTRTPEQLESMRKYVEFVISKHPNILIAGHNDFDKKDCPCFNVAEWCRKIGVPEKNIYKKSGVMK